MGLLREFKKPYSFFKVGLTRGLMFLDRFEQSALLCASPRSLKAKKARFDTSVQLVQVHHV